MCLCFTQASFKGLQHRIDLYQSIGVSYLDLNFKSGSLYINRKYFSKDVLRVW